MSNSQERTKDNNSTPSAKADATANTSSQAVPATAKTNTEKPANNSSDNNNTVDKTTADNATASQAVTNTNSTNNTNNTNNSNNSPQAPASSSSTSTSTASASTAATSIPAASAPAANTAKSTPAAAAPAAGPTTAPTNTAPETKTASENTNTDKNNVNFRTENIGKWASQQENPFEKQNRERQAELESRRASWHKYRPPIVVAACAVFAGLVTWGIVAVIMAMVNRPEYVPTISGNTFQDITDYAEKLQEIQKENPDNPNIIQETVDKTLETADGEQYTNEVLLAQMSYYYQNITCEDVIGMKDKIKVKALPGERQVSYYSMLYQCYDYLKMPEEAKQYRQLAIELSQLIREDNSYANE